MLGKLIVIGSAVLNLGTIREADGVVERSFWLRNDSPTPVTMVQGYTSCGCTTVSFPKDSLVSPSDSALVTLRFNPQGKGGEFYESATIQYVEVNENEDEDENKDAVQRNDGKKNVRQRLQLALEGTCITSEETLLKQHPVVIAEGLRQSANHFDVGYMSVGQSRTLSISVLHQDEDNRCEIIPIVFAVDAETPKGLQHIAVKRTTVHNGKEIPVTVDIDVIVR